MKGVLAEKKISLDRLSSFLEIVEAGSIVAAVGKDPSRQSLFSKHKADLEKVFGEDLFNLENGKLKPTSFGKELAAITTSFQEALNDLTAKSKNEMQPISIGAGDSVYQWLLLPIANRLQNDFRNITFQFRNLRTSEINEQIESGKIDIGITRSGNTNEAIAVTSLHSFQFGLFYHPDSFEKRSIRDILKANRLIGMTGTGSYVQNVKSLQLKHDAIPNFWIEFDSLPMIENSLMQTKACAILPVEAKPNLESKGFKVISGAKFNSFTRSYNLVRNANTEKIRKTVTQLAKHLEEILK